MAPNENTATLEGSPSPVVQIRQYRSEDQTDVVKLFSAGMLHYATENIEFWEGYVQQSIHDDLADIGGVYMKPGGNFWVATIEDKIVGMVGLEAKPNQEGELRRMSVNHEYRRYGIGRLLIAHLEAWAAANGFTKVWLSTGGVMTQARKFYLSLGYDHTKTEVYSQDPYFEAMFYAKTVAPSQAA
uniref:N-acetyltransferase domain-containing protein n=1 Tax=Globisporangium ultimum (strain ATCC 200006 / CBS 805.95 / DAOM BR144) TaxID=431595 RepID=K3XAQ9_GLOUD